MPDSKIKEIASQQWSTEDFGLCISSTKTGDTSVYISTDAYEQSTGVNLSVSNVREIAAALVQRVDLIDPPSRRKIGDVPKTPAEIVGEFLRFGTLHTKRFFDSARDPEGNHRISHIVNAFTIVALMAELEQVAPARAAEVAERLADSWDDGGSVSEFLHEWSDDHAAGRLVGFNPPAVLPLDVSRQ